MKNNAWAVWGPPEAWGPRPGAVGASSKEKSRINLNIDNTVFQQVEFSKYIRGLY